MSYASTTEDVRTHVELVEQKLESLSPRVANVVSADLDYGMIRMFEAISEGRLDHEFRVFRDLDEACGWLEIDPSGVVWPPEPG